MTPSWEIEVRDRKVVAGLVWVPLIATARTPMRREFKQHLRNHDSRYGVLHAPKGARYPLAGVVRPAERGERAFRGRIPAALWLAASVTRPTVFVGHRSPGVAWILAAAPGVPDPRGDVSMPVREASAAVRDLMFDYFQGHGEPELVIAPGVRLDEAVVGLPARRAALDELLQADPPRSVVAKQLGMPTWALAAAAGSATVASGLWLSSALMQHWERRQQERVAREAAVEKARQQAPVSAGGQAQESARRALASATATPWPQAMVSTCAQTFYQTPGTLGGWSLQQVQCDAAGGARATYVLPTDARFPVPTQASLRGAARALGLDADIGWFATSADVRLAMRLPPARPGLLLSQVPDERTVGEHLASVAQRISRLVPGAQLQADRPTTAEAPRATPHPPFQTGIFRASGKGLWLLREAVPNERFLSLRSVVLQRDQGAIAWSVEGTFVMVPK